jgi:hypothetical protein
MHRDAPFSQLSFPFGQLKSPKLIQSHPSTVLLKFSSNTWQKLFGRLILYKHLENFRYELGFFGLSCPNAYKLYCAQLIITSPFISEEIPMSKDDHIEIE